jgi:hypothetical protein
MSQRTGEPNESASKQVVNFSEIRAQKMDEKRRKTERIFFKHLLGVYSVTADKQMRPIEIIDVSEEGCSFQVPFEPSNPWPTELGEMPVRLYFSQDTYIPVTLKIQNSTHGIENGTRYMRFGCKVDQDTQTYVAYQQFVKFLKLYSEHAHRDMGDNTVFYL